MSTGSPSIRWHWGRACGSSQLRASWSWSTLCASAPARRSTPTGPPSRNLPMRDVQVIDDPAVAGVSLDPVRTEILCRLATPGSAAQLAAQLGLPRQKVNYHLRTLERHGLVELREERRKGNMTER